MLRRPLIAILLLTTIPLFSRDYRILYISSYNPSYSTYHRQIAGIESAFTGTELQLDEAFMDTKRFGTDENIAFFHSYLAYKIQGLPPYDMVIAADDNAFRFMKDNGGELFPNLPWVFLGVNDKEAGLGQNRDPLSTGILEFVSFQKNLELIHSQFPHADEVVVIYDGTPSGKADYVSLTSSLTGEEALRIKPLDLSSYTFDQMESFLELQEPGVPLLLLSAYLDSSGKRLDFSESFKRIYRSARGPVYHLWSHGFGEGVLGGYIVDHFSQGREAGKLARRILEGESPADIPVENRSPNHYCFDWNEMKRWDIPRRSLPEDSEIINTPVNRRLFHILTLLAAAVVVLAVLLILYHRLNVKLRIANSSLSESRDRFEELFRNNPVIMLLIDPVKGTLVDANKAALLFYGYTREEILSLSIFDINQLSRNQINREMNRATRERRKYFQFRHLLKDGTIKEVEVYSGQVKLNGVRYLLSAIHDISDKSRLRRELIQREKMNALGFLAGGIAHDFNNLLTGIIGYYDLLKMEDLDEETRDQSLDMIFQSALKAKDLTGKILSYSRNKEKKRVPLSLTEKVDECLEEKRVTLPRNIKVKKVFNGRGVVYANPAEIHQIVQNLVSNALQAMEEREGTLTVRIGPFQVNYRNHNDFNGMPLGEYQLLEVEDEGIGIPESNLQMLFDPYYTTKEMGTGTGLGLALVRSIVEEEEGTIRVSSAPGVGTLFKIYLPAYGE